MGSKHGLPLINKIWLQLLLSSDLQKKSPILSPPDKKSLFMLTTQKPGGRLHILNYLLHGKNNVLFLSE